MCDVGQNVPDTSPALTSTTNTPITMQKVNPKIFLLGQTAINSGQVIAWLTHLGVKDIQSVVKSFSESTGAECIIAMAGKRCYNSFEVGLNPNVKAIRDDMAKYIENILKSGHGSVLEHATWTFAIENVSRVFTAEMNRHRAGVAVSEGSGRYIRFGELAFTEVALTGEETVINKTNELMNEAFLNQERIYLDLCNLWQMDEMKDFAKKKELTSYFRRIVGQGVATGGIWTINARALRHIISMRAMIHAEAEIFSVFDSIADLMVSHEPLLFGDFEKTENGWRCRYPKV